jgi:hypothetical protein
MSETSRPSAAGDAVAARLKVYQLVLGANLVLIAGFVALAFVSPVLLARVFALPEAAPSEWVRVCAGMLAVVALLYLQGLLDPIGARWPNIVGIAARFAMGALFLSLGGGFVWFFAFDAAFGSALLILYLNLLRARPS